MLTTRTQKVTPDRAVWAPAPLWGALLIGLICGAAGGEAALADSTTRHRVTVRVDPISTLALRGGDVELQLQVEPARTVVVADESCGLSWMTNQTSQKITVATSLATPRIRLSVEAVGAVGGGGVGAVVVEGAARDFVVGVVPGTGRCGLRYAAEAEALAEQVVETHVVTYTMTDGR